MSGRTSLSDQFARSVVDRLVTAERSTKSTRQPIHVVYGGAHLFKADTVPKLGRIAASFFTAYAPAPDSLRAVFSIDEAIADDVHALITRKLAAQAVEDYRVDFEDGYGPRSDDEEDTHAISAAEETAKAIVQNTLSPFFGIRIKSLAPQSAARALRTLDLYLTKLCRVPESFVVTLPKVDTREQVAVLADVLDELESKLGFEKESIGIELMIETAQSVVAADGRVALPSLVEAGRGRVRSAHYGAYDYTAALGITAGNQDMRSSASDFARQIMQVSLAGTGVAVVDGATNILPIPPHRGDVLTDRQQTENRDVVARAWRLHFDLCRQSLANGFYQSWDLHPAQIPARLAAVYSFFLEQMDGAAARLKNFVGDSARATLVGDVFDDAATGQGLLNFFVRAIDCGALSELDAVERTGIAVNSLRGRAFANIVSERK